MRHGMYGLVVVTLLCVSPESASAEPSVVFSTPEAVVRESVLANERRDLGGMARLFLKDPDIVSFGIMGLKFVGWAQLEPILRSEFQSVNRLEITVKELKVWTRGDVAWFSMELDYARILPGPQGETRMLLELRETGVLEKRDGQWLFHSWHESPRRARL